MSSRLVGPIGRRKSSSLVGLAVALVMLVGGWAMAVNLGLLERPMRVETPSFEPGAARQAGAGIVDTVVLTALKSPGPTSNRFAIAGTAVVELRRIDAGLALTSVEAEPGWAWSASDETSGNVAIEFESDDDTMTFSAAVDKSGSVVALVQSLHHGQSQTTASPAPDEGDQANAEGIGSSGQSNSEAASSEAPSSSATSGATNRTDAQWADRAGSGQGNDRPGRSNVAAASGGADAAGDGDGDEWLNDDQDDDEQRPPGDDDGRYDDD